MTGVVIHTNVPDDFPIDRLLTEIAALRGIAWRLQEARRECAHPGLADVEMADTPEQLAALVAWVEGEIDVRHQAITDWSHGREPAWPPVTDGYELKLAGGLES